MCFVLLSRFSFLFLYLFIIFLVYGILCHTGCRERHTKYSTLLQKVRDDSRPRKFKMSVSYGICTEKEVCLVWQDLWECHSQSCFVFLYNLSLFLSNFLQHWQFSKFTAYTCIIYHVLHLKSHYPAPGDGPAMILLLSSNYILYIQKIIRNLTLTQVWATRRSDTLSRTWNISYISQELHK